MSKPAGTLAEVARHAGVSLSTASKAINGREEVAPATRERVMRALEEVGYQTPAHRTLASAEPRILVLLESIETMYAATVLQGIISGGAMRGAEVVVRIGAGRRADPHQALDRTRAPIGCVGIIAVTYAMRGLQELSASSSLPVVIVDPSEIYDTSWMTVGAMNWTGARAATDHLIELSHTKIAWLGGPKRSEPAFERLNGHQAALTAAGISVPSSYVAFGDFTTESGRRHAAAMLASDSPPTAFVAANDEVAIGAMAAVRAAGLSVPGDVSVVGFDDTPQASWVTPMLTSVRQPLIQMGQLAVRMILDEPLEGSPDSRHLQLAARLVVRESTAPPPSTPQT